MGRDTWKFRAQERDREMRRRPNPILRGVGCLLLSVLTIAGYFFTGWFFQQNALNSWIYLPPEVIRPSITIFDKPIQLFPPGVFMTFPPPPGLCSLVLPVFSFHGNC